MTAYSLVYVPCPVHEHYRLIDETGCRECYRQRAKASKPKPPAKIYQLPKQSAKQAQLKREMAQTRKEIAAERGNVCEGCGKREGGMVVLEDSHVISLDYCNQYGREDLKTDKRNRRRHCRTWFEHKGCHGKWESNSERHLLLDYQRNMAFIKQEIPELCRKMLMNQTNAKLQLKS